MANGGPDDERFEAQVRALARLLPYPPTPDVARLTRATPARPRLRLAWVILILGIVVGLLAVPQVRAALIEFFQIGGVRVYLEPTPTSTPPSSTSRASPTPPAPTVLPSLLDLAGETTLAEIEARTGRAVLLPPDDGPPDRVFYQEFDANGWLVVLVWLDPADAQRVRLSVHEMVCKLCLTKGAPSVLLTTTVNGQPALWAEGPYLVQLGNGDLDFRRLVEGHVLIWEVDGVTYRLETDLPLTEATTLAESLK